MRVAEGLQHALQCITLQASLHALRCTHRAETIRILLDYGGIPFEDVAFPRESWPEMKLKMPFGQVPVLEVSRG